MPDQIGNFYVLNKLQPPADHNWKLQKISRDFVDGDAWQKQAQRADETHHQCKFFVASAAGIPAAKTAIMQLAGQAGLSMVCDGQTYDEIVVTMVGPVTVQPLQRHTACYAYDGTLIAGGAGGRIMTAVIHVGRSNQPT